jgi:hypothetical protein
MNRRKFFAGVGSIAAVGAAARIWQSEEPATPAQSPEAPVGHSIHQTPASAIAFERLPGSEEFIHSLLDSPVNRLAYKLGISSYDRAAISILGYEPGEQNSLQSLDLVVNYQLSEPPYQAPFYAFRLRRNGQAVDVSQPVSFDVAAPEGATLGVSYRLDPQRHGNAAWGALSFGIGGFGLGPGIYVLAGLSASTLSAPRLDLYTWGEVPGKIAHRGGEPIDFDYLCLALTPKRG